MDIILIIVALCKCLTDSVLSTQYSVPSNTPGEAAAALTAQPWLAGLLPRLDHHTAGAVRAVPAGLQIIQPHRLPSLPK